MRRLNKDYPYQKQLKNRSSKDNNMLVGMKSIFRCVSMEQLKDWVNKEVKGAAKEYERRKARIIRRYGEAKLTENKTKSGSK